MNLGIERFLILGCIAVLILEAPSLMADLARGDGSAAILALSSSARAAQPVAAVVQVEALATPPVAALVVQEQAPDAVAIELDATALANLLTGQPGL